MSSLRYRCGDYQLDPANRRLVGPSGLIAVEPRVFAVIVELVTRADALVTRDALLDAVWGHRYATPSTLNRVITLARRAFADDVATPRYIQTVYGAGYRYVGPVEVVDGEELPEARRSGPPPRCLAPVRTQALIGREPDLARLDELLAAQRAVSILGSGGMGKTQCAIELAQRIAGRFPGGVWFFDLVAMHRGEDWLAALASALSIFGTEREALVRQIAARISDRAMLLVLDNCDRIALQVGSVVIELLRLTRNPRVLATTQTPLCFAGEQLYRLEPLSLESSDPLATEPLQSIASAPAVEMLVTRARLVQPGFALTGENAHTVLEICRRLDAMPLALEFAAARFNLLSAEQILERLDQRFRFLGSTAAGVDERHRNLMALLDWSCSLLSHEEQRLLCWCGVFVQGWTVEGLLPMGEALGHNGEATVDLLSSLVDHSLVSVDVSLTPPRYRLLETVREYALARLAATGEEAAARRAHLGAVRDLCEKAHGDVLAGRMTARTGQLARDYGNIRSAAEWSTGSKECIPLGQDMLGSLLCFIRNHDSYRIVSELAARLVAGPPEELTRPRGRCLLVLGISQWGYRVRHGADGWMREAARNAEHAGDLWTFAYALASLAMWNIEQGAPEEAVALMAGSERVSMQLGDPLLEGLVKFARGWYLLSQGDPATASRELEAARDLGTDLAQRQFIGIYVGLTHYLAGNLAQSAQGFLQSLQQYAILGSLRFAAGNLEGAAYLCVEHGLFQEAVRLMAAAAGIRGRTVPLLSFWKAHHEAAERRARAALGEQDYLRAEQLGLEADEEETIAFALELLVGFAAGADSASKGARQTAS